MTLMRMILDEAAERYHFDSHFKGIKQLKEEKADIHSFSLDEVWLFLNNIRKGYRNYYLVRFFTGLRTSEIDGLTWQYVDFHRRSIRVKQALVNDVIGATKTRGSNRDVEKSQLVFDALKEQEAKPLQIIKLGKSHQRKQFDCGTPVLNRFLQQQAGQLIKRGETVVYMMCDEQSQSPQNVLGLYTLSTCQIEQVIDPQQLSKQSPYTPFRAY